MSNPNQTRPRHDPITSSDSEVFAFVDPIGGLPLDDPEVKARERRARPTEKRKDASEGVNETPQAE